MSSDQDYFYVHPDLVLLGFFDAVLTILVFLLIALWMGYKVW